MNSKLPIKQLLHTFASQAAVEPVAVVFWDGERRRYGRKDGPPVCTVHFKTRKALQQTLFQGSLGFGEAYTTGEVEVEGDLQQLIRMSLNPGYDSCLANGTLDKIRPILGCFTNLNSIKGARRAISFHYDRGNDFYQEWLDRSMTYSCAYFRREDNSLEQAQADKYEHICRKLLLKPGEKLIDIGCGWGGMLIYAARHYQIAGEGYTLSRNQLEFARRRAAELGVGDRLQFHLRDYREATGVFDKFVSIGMFEHVGSKYYADFFAMTRRLLRPGGIGVLHTIGKNDGSPTDPWITTYIFPGGELPQLYDICRHLGRQNLQLVDLENLRRHYYLTLQHWIDRFESRLDRIRQRLQTSREEADQFIRCWRLYLNGSAVNFLHGDLNLYQLTFTRGLVNDLPLTREHLYR
ncbi:MAG: class I SAM-dependent methyltransferase [Deltaproteobacteria bacterium]|nr:class I SAM-dependent methyltransferase [Deltaproteobacteria bacterium]